MATVFTQDAVLHFLQNSGGKVKNSELLQHFRNFIRNHADQDRNRELFKKFVNSVAIVKQEDGVNYVVLRKKYKGYVSGVGGGASWLPAGKNPETSPGGTTVIPAVNADKPRVKHTQRREEAAPSPQGETTGTAVLPVAGIIHHNNNNNTEMMFNQKQKQQQLNSTSGLSGRPSDLTQISEKTDLSQPHDPVQCTKVPQQKVGVQFSAAAPVVSAVRHHGGSSQQVMVQTPRGTEPGPQPGGGGGPHQGSALHVNVEPQMAPRRLKYRPSYKTAVSHDDDEEEEQEEFTVRRGSAEGVWPLSAPLENMRVISTSSPCIIDQPTPPSFVTSSSSSSSERNLPKIYIQGVKKELSAHDQGETFQPRAGFKGQWTGSRLEDRFVSPELISTSNNQPLKAECYTPSPDRTKEASPRSDVFQDLQYSQASGVKMDPRQGSHQRTLMSSSLSSSISPLSDASLSSSNWPPSGSSRGSGWSSSHEDLHTRTFSTSEAEHAPTIQEVLQRVQRTRPQSVMHLADSETTEGYLHGNQTPTAYLSPFHHSTEYLHDDRGLWRNSTDDLNDNRDEAESSDGSAATPPMRQRPTVARRFSSQLRNRMCRSLGADLDQLLHEQARVGEGAGGGSEAARLNRLHLISSSLSLRYNLSSSSLSSCSTPPRCHSLADLAEGEDRKRGRRSLPADIVPSTASTAQPQGSSKQSLVPLEPREHTWLVKAAAGAWPDIYSLFREDSSLLNKQDFISGFTVLHWIAKHGDHRVLNTLWYGVEKAGLMFDVNARSTCGHTPLHLSAMHGHKNIMRLLVKKFDANVKLRDIAGKKPWQYLSRGAPLEFFQLLGAPARAFMGGEGGVNSWEQQQQQQQKQRRRRHHFSTASSGERPLTIAGMTKVKRSSSIAAFLKHKSLHRFHGHQSDSSV